MSTRVPPALSARLVCGSAMISVRSSPPLSTSRRSTVSVLPSRETFRVRHSQTVPALSSTCACPGLVNDVFLSDKLPYKSRRRRSSRFSIRCLDLDEHCVGRAQYLLPVRLDRQVLCYCFPVFSQRAGLGSSTVFLFVCHGKAKCVLLPIETGEEIMLADLRRVTGLKTSRRRHLKRLFLFRLPLATWGPSIRPTR